MTYHAEVLADSPSAYFPLQDSSSPLSDDSGHGHTMALYHGSGSYQQAGPSDQKSLDISAGRWDTAWVVNQTAYTFEAWVKTTDPSAANKPVIGAWGGAAATGVMMWMDSGTLNIYHGATLVSFGSAPSTTRFDHFVGVWNGSNLKLYKNKVLISTTTLSTAPGTSSGPLQISSYGNLVDSDRDFPGFAAHIAVYDTALSAARIAAHYNAMQAGSPLGLEILTDEPDLYWKLNDVSGITAPVDDSGNGRVGTVNGAINPGFGQAAVFSGLGTSVGLDGTGNNHYIYRPYESALDVGTGDFAIEMVVNLINSTSNYVEIWGRDDNQGGYFLVRLAATTGILQCYAGLGVVNGTHRVNDGQPHHIVFKRESGVAKIFLDGVLEGSASLGGSTDHSSAFRLGVVDGSYGTAYGDIQHVAYYTHALSDARIAAHYAAITGLVGTPDVAKQGATGYIYENVGLHIVDSDNADGYIYENVGFLITDSDNAYGYIFENVGFLITDSDNAYGFAYENTGVTNPNPGNADGYIYEDSTIRVPSYWGRMI